MRRPGSLGCALAILFSAAVPGGEAGLSLAEADNRLGVAFRLIEGGVFERAGEIAASILDAPGAAASDDPNRGEWLRRREMARFALDRSLLGLAVSREDFQAAAVALGQLADNRYRLADPAYDIQAAYWAARANEAIGEYREAVRLYTRVGGVSLPLGLEGDAAQRTSRCLRRLADELPYPGGLADRQLRDRLLNQAISELDRARLAFPMGDRRREIELDMVALRLSRREPQFVRDAASAADALIAGDAARDRFRARAVFYRGQAASMLGNPQEAAAWFRRVLGEENPDDEDRRNAGLGLALSLMELSESAGADAKRDFLAQAEAALDQVLAGADGISGWDGARVVKAHVLLSLEQPTAALETLAPILKGGRVRHSAWMAAGLAELARGRPAEAVRHFYPVSRPSNPDVNLRRSASQKAAGAARARRDFGFALAMNHRASRMIRRELLFSTLLVSEFQAMETILDLGRMDGPLSLSGNIDLLMIDTDDALTQIGQRRAEGAGNLAEALGRLLAGGGNPDSAYDLATAAEAAWNWSGDGAEKLKLAIGMAARLRQRQPSGIADSVLSSRLGEAHNALALAKVERLLAGVQPDIAGIENALADFAAASAAFQAAYSGGRAIPDSLDQGMVGMESGGFLTRLADRWNRGIWLAESLRWRDEARRRVEASLIPFNHALAASPPSSLAARRAKWSRGRALEFLGDWRGAGADYLALMNNSELPRAVRINAARRWAVCMGELGDGRQALARLAVFADNDAEAALLAGKLAEASDNPREACRRYFFAADPASPSLPPATPGRAGEAAYRAAKLIFANPSEADPLTDPAVLVASARELLEKSVAADLGGPWAISILELLGDSWMSSPDPNGWLFAHRLAAAARERPDASPELDRAMCLVAARAMAAGGRFEEALQELDRARELLDREAAPQPRDAARIALETARVYRKQGRYGDAVRAFANVFASYPGEEAEADAARLEAAETIMLPPASPGEREREQARGIISGLTDQLRAEKLLREYGIH
ncbi:MAG: tetratricopeptide repeat protein [Planctomycetota bacterium]|nr:tetratricopeptide repeat protein [Planctomycetota bacterium]